MIYDDVFQVALTDDEMNALGAKILKAEIMGNDEMAQQLKQKLEQARNARAAGVKPAPSSNEEKVSSLYVKNVQHSCQLT